MARRIGYLAIAILMTAAIVAAVMMRGGASDSTSEAPPSPSFTATPVVTSSASTSPAGSSCQLTSRSGFSELVLDYEQAYLSPDSPAKAAVIGRLATKHYIDSYHAVSNPNQKGSDTVITVNRDLSRSVICMTQPAGNGAVRYVDVTAMISTSHTDTEFHAPAHSTTWILVGKQWMLDQER